MVFKKKKKKEVPEVPEEISEGEEMIDLPNEDQDTIERLTEKIKELEEAKGDLEEEPEGEVEEVKESVEVPEIKPAKKEQAAIPQTRMVYLTDSEAIRQILAEVQNLRYMFEQEVAKE